MFDLQCFENNQFGRVRVIERDGEPWFVAKDVCDCLELGNPSQAVARLDDDERCLISNDALRSNGEITIISESGLYNLILGSRKPEAKAFKRWITHEVIPSIRKTGAYSVVPKTLQEALRAYADALDAKALADAEAERQRRIAEEAIRTKAQIGSRREATAMNTASQKSKECERLRDQLGDSKHWKQVKAIRWLPQYFEMSRGLYGAIAHILKGICMDHGWARRDIPDTEYGTVKAYPVEAIDILRNRIEANPDMLWKYRKTANA